MGLDGKNLTNFTQSFSEALASSATSRLIGAAAAASSASTSSQSGAASPSPSTTSYYSTWFFLVHPPKLLIAETRRMAAEIDLVTLLALIGLIFVICLYLIHLIALLYGKHRLHRKVERSSNLPGVSIIKPIVGADENLRENLETFFVAEYHKYEILFCFHNQTDPAVKIVKSLIEKYPKIDAHLFFGGEKVGLNPKINNMMPAYRSAKYPLILISDSAIFMRQDAILDMVQTMVSHEKMAIVTQTPYCKNRPGLAAAFEQVYFGTFHARIYLAGNCMEFVCSTGMSSMMRKDALDECGGIAAFGGYLAEDFFFGKELANRGWKSAISVNPALQNAANPKLSTFLERICRWVKLRIAMLPHIILVEPLQDCFPAGIIIATCANFLMGFNPLLIFAAHVAFWITVDFLLMHTMQNGELCFATWQFLALWILRELSAPVVFLMALCQPKIEWRKNVFKLAWGGRIMPQK